MPAFRTTRRTLLQLIGSLPIFRLTPGRAADTFTLVPALETGQVMRYRLESQVLRDGAIAHRSRSTVTLEIVDRVDDGWLARWTAAGSTLLDADPRVRPMHGGHADRADFIVDTASAWPVRVSHVRRVSAAGRSRVDCIELTRLADPLARA